MTSLANVFGDEVAFRDWYDRALPSVYRDLLARCAGNQHKLVDHYGRASRDERRHAEVALVPPRDAWHATELRDAAPTCCARPSVMRNRTRPSPTGSSASLR